MSNLKIMETKSKRVLTISWTDSGSYTWYIVGDEDGANLSIGGKELTITADNLDNIIKALTEINKLRDNK